MIKEWEIYVKIWSVKLPAVNKMKALHFDTKLKEPFLLEKSSIFSIKKNF